MNIKIKTHSFDLRVPDDADAALIAKTGFSLDETLRLLGTAHVAGDVAAVLLVFAEGPDVPAIGELAIAIADVGVREVGAQLASILTTGTIVEDLHSQDGE